MSSIISGIVIAIAWSPRLIEIDLQKKQDTSLECIEYYLHNVLNYIDLVFSFDLIQLYQCRFNNMYNFSG